MSEKYQIDLYILSIAEPIVVDDCIDNQIRNWIERVNKDFSICGKNYKAIIKEEKSGRSSHDSDCKQLKNILHKAIELCTNYHQTNREVFTEPYEEAQNKPLHHLEYKVNKVVKCSVVAESHDESKTRSSLCLEYVVSKVFTCHICKNEYDTNEKWEKYVNENHTKM